MEKLTKREIDVLEYLVKGYSNQQIANILNISKDTVKLYLKRIFLKMNVCNRVEAAVTSVIKGIVKNTAE